MTDRDVLIELNKNINTLMVRTATTATTVAHIKEAIKPIDELIAWRNRWGGGLIAVSLVSTLLGLAGTTLGILLAVNEFKP
jgi:hypothetical protein